MNKIAILLLAWFAFTPPLHSQDDWRAGQRSDCMDACMRERPNPDLQRQEVIALEKETARAIQLGDATFFRRVYSDDFSGVSSHGQTVDRAGLIAAVQTPEMQYESFVASDIKVRLYRDLAVATSSWSIRGVVKGQRVTGQMRVMHIYVYGGGGYRVATGQITLLPPYFQQPL